MFLYEDDLTAIETWFTARWDDEEKTWWVSTPEGLARGIEVMSWDKL